MPGEPGKVVDCPNCRGHKVLNKRRCNVCVGTGRVEYQERDGFVTAPAGSWLPARRPGRTGYQVVLFGGPKQAQTR